MHSTEEEKRILLAGERALYRWGCWRSAVAAKRNKGAGGTIKEGGGPSRGRNDSREE